MQKLITSMIRISIFACLAVLAGTLFLLPRITNQHVYARSLCNGSCSGSVTCNSGQSPCICESFNNGPLGCHSISGPVPPDEPNN
jgi:hypothetical protein